MSKQLNIEEADFILPCAMPPHPVASVGEWPCVLVDREAVRAWFVFGGEWELELLSELPDVDLGSTGLHTLVLVRSELRPEGALYTPLQQFDLGG